MTDAEQVPDSSSAQAPDSAPPQLPYTAPTPADRPELAVAGAFAGGLVLALILKRLAR